MRVYPRVLLWRIYAQACMFRSLHHTADILQKKEDPGPLCLQKQSDVHGLHLRNEKVSREW